MEDSDFEIGDQVVVNATGQKAEVTSFTKDGKVVVALESSGRTITVSEEDIDAWNEDEHGDAEDDDDDDDEVAHDADEFYVAVYDEHEERSWIGLVTKKTGTKWHEKPFKGQPDYRWGSSYMSYLTPEQVMQWIRKDYGRGYDLEGPFDTAEEAQEYVSNHFGGEIEMNESGWLKQGIGTKRDVRLDETRGVLVEGETGWLKEGLTMGTALKRELSKPEPGSKLDLKIKKHNADIKAGGKGLFDTAPEGYKFKKDRTLVLEGVVATVKKAIKSVKRGMSGWDAKAVGPNGEKLGDPKDLIKRQKEMTDDQLKAMHATIHKDIDNRSRFMKQTKGSPGDLQTRVVDREIKKRGLKTDEAFDFDRDALRKHPGNSSYMDDAYMLNHYKERLAKIEKGPYKYPKEVARLKASIAKIEAKKVKESPNDAGLDKHSMIGKIKRGFELKKKVDSTWLDAVKAEKEGDGKAATRAFLKHVRYTNLERPGTWRDVKESASFSDFEEWKKAVLLAYPAQASKMKFKGRIEGKKQTVSAEIPGEDRSYGVWDMDDETGVVLSEGASPFKPNAKVKIVGGPADVRGQIGYIGEIKTDAAGNRTFVVDISDGGAKAKKSVSLKAKDIRLFKESVTIEEGWLKEAFAKKLTPMQILNKLAKSKFGEFGFASLSEDDMAQLIDVKKADKLADKYEGEFGIASCDEAGIEKIVNKHPDLLIGTAAQMLKKQSYDYLQAVYL